jgi:hypothetical protein
MLSDEHEMLLLVVLKRVTSGKDMAGSNAVIDFS